MAAATDEASVLGFVWLEITGRCQLACSHCYAESSPHGDHGSMTVDDWLRIIGHAADLGAGAVQFIGGEPTLHPNLPELVDHALSRGLAVEVYSNLVHVTEPLWQVFSQDGVALATSYYTDDPAQHAGITGRPSHARTRANIAEAARRRIPLRVGLIDFGDTWRADDAHAQLVDLGVSAISRDRVRHIGRGSVGQRPPTAQLCGRCGDGTAAVAPDGSVWPCVFARWLPLGNVHADPLATVLRGAYATQVLGDLRAEFDRRWPAMPCAPNLCDPQCGPSCSPACRPAGNCRPVGACAPDYR